MCCVFCVILSLTFLSHFLLSYAYAYSYLVTALYSIPMSSSPTKKIISAEVKDDYQSECWHVSFAGDENDDTKCLTISIRHSPTKASDFVKWKTLMRKVANAPIVVLFAYNHIVVDDKKTFNHRCLPLFCEALNNNTIIAALTVYPEVLDEIGMTSICKVLQTHTTITYAGMMSEHFSHSIAHDLQQIVELNNTLTTLEVDVNAEDVIGLARALPHNSTLTELGLWGYDRKLGNEGLRTLCDGLRGNHSIVHIDLRSNDISDEGATYLCSLTEVNHSITWVYLGGNLITSLPQNFAFLTHITLDLSDNTTMSFPPKHVVDDQGK